MPRDLVRGIARVVLIWCFSLIDDVRGCSALVAQSLTAYPNVEQILMSENYPNPYPNDHDRCWKIKTSEPGYVINVATAEFEVEYLQDEPCGSADFLEIRDGYYETSQLLKKMCGTERTNLTSTGDAMYIRFKSDESVAQKGFLVRYKAIKVSDSKAPVVDLPLDGCDEITRLTAFATITSSIKSPNYPNGYPASVDRCWLVEALDDNMAVLITVVDSLMEESYSCESGDYVEARDGNELSDRRLVIFCGDEFPPGFKSSGPQVLLRFHTDQTANDFPGFHLQYLMVEPNKANGLPCSLTYHCLAFWIAFLCVQSINSILHTSSDTNR